MAETPNFPPRTLPYGVFTRSDDRRRLGVAVGSDILDLDAEAEAGGIQSVPPTIVQTGRLNDLLAAGRPAWQDLRDELLNKVEEGRFATHPLPAKEATMRLAWEVADYVDFYSSRYHAENVGRLFRPNNEPLLPNWLHLPVGYHGRAGTVVVDGTPIRRPCGQRRNADGEIEFGPSTRLDIELEVGFVLGGSSDLGHPVPISRAADHLFGVVLVNDWSARDIQAWEYVPLGPFLGQSFATSVSAWVVPMAALDAARVPGPVQDNPRPLPYLQSVEHWALALDLEVWLRPAGQTAPTMVARVNAAEGLYWNAAQQLAHMTVNGATVRPGDLFASGTVSGPDKHQRGSLLELSWGGSEPIQIESVTRTFLEDGDEVVLRATAPGRDGPTPLGPVAGVIQPSAHNGRE